MNNRVIVVLGPTATGKSDLAVEIALKFNGEIISADSRQVYKGLDIGTGKITTSEMKSVPHYLLDISDPKNKFTVTDWQRIAEKKIQDILSRNKIPIICGGTGFYIDSIIYNQNFPEVTPDERFRSDMEAKTNEELINLIKEKNPDILGSIDVKNKRKLIRALEILNSNKEIQKLNKEKRKDLEFLLIGLRMSSDEIKSRINLRLDRRIEAGMIKEAEDLHTQGLGLNRMKELGLEYKYLAMLINKEISISEMTTLLKTKIWQYARRQITWFKRNKDIKWFEPKETEKIMTAVKEFLN